MGSWVTVEQVTAFCGSLLCLGFRADWTWGCHHRTGSRYTLQLLLRWRTGWTLQHKCLWTARHTLTEGILSVIPCYTCWLTSLFAWVAAVFQVEVEKYTKGVLWLHELLYQVQFTPERLKVLITTMTNDVARMKRSGRTVVSCLLKNMLFNKSKLKNCRCCIPGDIL